MEEFYKDLFSKGKKTKVEKKNDKDQELNQLYTKPKVDKFKETPHNKFTELESYYQADTLYLPDDENGYKYLLVVVDTANGKTDAEPMKTLETREFVEGFKKIFQRMGTPKYIQTDSGSEFKKHVKKYFKDNKIMVKKTLVGRSRQNGLVEARNKQISRAIFKRQTAEEILTGEIERNWVDDLPYILKYINMNAKDDFKEKLKAVEQEIQPLLKGTYMRYQTPTPKAPEVEVFTTEAYKFGQKVRVQLDKPISTKGDKLHGRFRVTDIRFSPDVYTIDNIIIQDGQPIMYIVKNTKTNEVLPVAYTTNQLLPIDKIIKPSEDIQSKKSKYIVEKILDKKTDPKDKRVYFYVKWKNYSEKESTWEPRSNLINEVPDLIKEYDANLRAQKRGAN